jgi:hypothetical protein
VVGGQKKERALAQNKKCGLIPPALTEQLFGAKAHLFFLTAHEKTAPLKGGFINSLQLASIRLRRRGAESLPLDAAAIIAVFNAEIFLRRA